MSNKHFNTVEETISWRNFKLGYRVYDLSHLDAHEAEYIESRSDGNSITYRYIVTYSFHCFTKNETNQNNDYLYHAPKESRYFNFRRYQLSFQLRDIISSLDKHICFHASKYKGRESYAICKFKDEMGNDYDYKVAFVSFKEKKKLRLHITTAHPLDQPLGKIKKIGFFVIAHNTLYERKFKSPK